MTTLIWCLVIGAVVGLALAIAVQLVRGDENESSD